MYTSGRVSLHVLAPFPVVDCFACYLCLLGWRRGKAGSLLSLSSLRLRQTVSLHLRSGAFLPLVEGDLRCLGPKWFPAPPSGGVSFSFSQLQWVLTCTLEATRFALSPQLA